MPCSLLGQSDISGGESSLLQPCFTFSLALWFYMSFLYKSRAGLSWRPGKFQEARFSATGPVLLEPVAQLCLLCGAREDGRDAAALQGSQDMPPCAQMVLPEDASSLAATKHCSFSFSPLPSGLIFPWCLHVPHAGEGIMLHGVVEETWYLLGSKIPMQTWGSALIHLGDPSWSSLTHSKISCSDVFLEPEATQIHLQDLNSSLTAVGFHSKSDRNNLSQMEWFL